jgi:hypothetical protein
MAIPSYPITTFIQGSACIGDSRTTLNANFSALDFNLTSLNTSVSTASLSARFINLVHSPFNDGTNPNLFIGEVGDGSAGSVLGSLSGFNIYYDETNNKLNTSTQQGTVTSNIISYNLNGNVGIGTVNPNQLLTVNGNISATNYVYTNKVNIGSTDNGVPLIIGLSGANNYNASIVTTGPARYHLYNGGAITEWVMGQKSSIDHSFKLTSRVSGNETDYVAVSSNGYVGLGTTTPNQQLTVSGNISATGAASVSALQINNSTTQTTKLSTLTTASKFPIYDATGTLLGFIPICSF